MKAIFLSILLISITKSEIIKPTENNQESKPEDISQNKNQSDSKDLDMQQDFMNQFQQMFDQMPQTGDLDQKTVGNTQRGLKTDLVSQDKALASKTAENDEMNQMKMMQEMMSKMDQDSFDNTKNVSLAGDDQVKNNLDLEAEDKPEDLNSKNEISQNNKPSLENKNQILENSAEINQKPATQNPQMQMDDYTPPTFDKPLAATYKEARKLEDGDKMEDIEKRLFSIEDKIDHLLMHVGHEVTQQKMTWTPWGMHMMPNYHNPNSLHQKLSMVDRMFPHGMGMGMSHMNMGMGMHHMGMPYGMMGSHAMGLGHANPWGYGLDHVGGGWNNYASMGLGRRASYGGSSNPYYTGNGSII